MPVVHGSGTATRETLHWRRIVGGAFLLEIVLFLVLVPIGLRFGMPGVPGATDFTVFFIAVPAGCFVGGAAIAAWMLRRVASRRALHGVLLGVTATLLYFAICAVQPGGVSGVIAAYGARLFWASQLLRIAGCVLGGSIGLLRRSRP